VRIYMCIFADALRVGPGEERSQPQGTRVRLAFASLIFEGSTLEKQDRRRDYGEVRIVATGLADGIALTVAYTDRLDDEGERVRRIISARRSNRRERKAYQAAIEEAE